MALTLNDVGKKKTPAKTKTATSKVAATKAAAGQKTAAKKPTAKKTKSVTTARKSSAKKPVRAKAKNSRSEAKPTQTVKKVRPWQTPEEMQQIEDLQTQKAAAAKDSTSKAPMPPKTVRMQLAGKPLPQEVVDVLQRVEGFKNECLAQLPPEVNAFVKDTWVTKLQVYPKIKIPMPGFLVRKEK